MTICVADTTSSWVSVLVVQPLSSPALALQVAVNIPCNREEIALHREFPNSTARRPNAQESL